MADKKTALDLATSRRFSAGFHAKYLHALEPIIRSSQEDDRYFDRDGLWVEPCAEGGVLLIATDGVCLAAVRDPEGHATQAMRVYIPDAIFTAVAPPPPVTAWSQGEKLAVPLPEWAQPRSVFFYELAAMVSPAMHHPSEEPEWSFLLGEATVEEGNHYRGGYRLHETKPLPWRKVLASTSQAGVGEIAIDPGRLGMFDRLFRLFFRHDPEGGRSGSLIMSLGATEGAVRIQILNAPDFVGAFMPLKKTAVPAIPEWSKEPVPA